MTPTTAEVLEALDVAISACYFMDNGLLLGRDVSEYEVTNHRFNAMKAYRALAKTEVK